jgi:hypothetical protein
MPEISLPTKATQDLIKAKTDLIGSPNPTVADTATIMNYLKKLEDRIAAGGGGTDFSKYTPLYSALVVPANGTSATLTTLASITGEGILTGMGSSTSNGRGVSFYEVYIDGQYMYIGSMFDGPQFPIIPFKNSVQIKVYNSASTSLTGYVYYLLK